MHASFVVFTSDEHRSDGEDLLGVGVGRNVTEADRSETRAGEVQSGDVRRHCAGKVRPFTVDRIIQLLGQLIQPAYHTPILYTSLFTINGSKNKQ